MYFSLLITATGHIKLTDFGLSKIGLMSCKYLKINMLFYENKNRFHMSGWMVLTAALAMLSFHD